MQTLMTLDVSNHFKPRSLVFFFLFSPGPWAQVDVVVVGAGLAGLACALRLKDQNPKLRCAVLEARNLVGGRASRGGADWVHGQHVATWQYLKLGALYNEVCCHDKSKASQSGRWQWSINIQRDSGISLWATLTNTKDEGE